MWENAVWIGIPAEELRKRMILEGDLTGRFAYYRCDLELPAHAGLTIAITANSRYRLWINGIPVLSGPCKGDFYRHYYETVEVSSYLKAGKNVFAVQVLYNSAYGAVKQTDERAGIFSVLTPGGGHRLAVEGYVYGPGRKILGSVTTGEADWRVFLDGSCCLKSSKVTENLGAVCEEPDFRLTPFRWKDGAYSIAGWSVPSKLETVRNDIFSEFAGLTKRFPVQERPIPLLYEREEKFYRELETESIRKSDILEKEKLQVSPVQTVEILLDAGCIVNGYPRFTFRGGAGTKVRITYFEKFIHDTEMIHRDDALKGNFEGITDCITLNGEEATFEPFWYRTFRFVYIEIGTGSEAVEMEAPVYRKTGYPLEVVSHVRSTEPWVGEVWEVCVRTLENCMMETYMDCPYYEQMQFVMDTRLQALFTYLVGNDVCLVKKALYDFHCSMTPDGLIQGKYPCIYPQIISTFSLHYIYMLEEYYQQTGDVKEVRRYFPDMDQILDYYERKTGADGLVERLGYWEFVDWQEAWEESGGVPEEALHGPSTIINLMYAYALECAARLNETAGRRGMAEEYRTRKAAILQEIHCRCWDKEREMYREGPVFEQYTCHAQAWAVINGLPDTETARNMLRHAAEDADVLKCSFSTSYEWFRACEMAGVYDYTKEDMRLWQELPALGCTCCPETPGNTRSECHAWSALPMYEMIRVIAGIRMGKAGWESVRIKPHMQGLPGLEGCAATPKGNIRFRYYRTGVDKNGKESWRYTFTLPEGLDGEFVNVDGSTVTLRGGRKYELNHIGR